MKDQPVLIWYYVDKKETPWKPYGFYNDGSYYSRTKLIAKFIVK